MVVLGVSLCVLSVPTFTMRQTVAALIPPNNPLTTGNLTKLVAGRLSKLDCASASLVDTFCAMMFRSVVVDDETNHELDLIDKFVQLADRWFS